MAMNFFKYKNMFSYAMAGFLPILTLTACLLAFKTTLMTATIISMAAVVGGIFIGRAISSHPWLSALEGKGIWAMDIASPGFMKPMLATMTDGKNIYINTPTGIKRTLFNRAISFYMKFPGKAQYTKKPENGTIVIDKESFTESNFSFMDQPVFLYNSKTGAFLTKEALGKLETTIMTEHLGLLELEQQRDLSKDIHELNRGVVDKFAPSGLMELITNPWFIAIVVIIGLILIIMFMAPQLDKLSMAGASAGNIVQGSLVGGN